MVEGRADLLDTILDDSFTAQHITGYVSPKGEWLTQVRSGEITHHSICDQGTTVALHGRRGRYQLQRTSATG
jgi:hypothetical protein